MAAGCGTPASAPPRPEAGYAGSAACVACHAAEHAAWAASLHAAALRTADAPGLASVLPSGDLTTGAEEVLRVVRAQDGPVVEASPPGDTAARAPLPYVLGRRPLEQLLAAVPVGRLQALPIAFDIARREWFDLFAGDPREPGDWGHWTGRGMTANSQCLACHTTGYEKRYQPADDSYASRWAEAGVGCEACHGPRSAHVASRRSGAADTPTPPLAGEPLLDLCATCHALRRERWDGHRPGAAWVDYYEPVLLDGDEYHPDGQLQVESYEWGSFVQSAMYRAGVTCLDCHDAHGTALRAAGNALCIRCHDAALDTPAHTRHATGTPGSACLACHMPVTVFMQRDPRRDHSFVLPDPEASRTLGVPNACAACHAAEGPAWAATHVATWFGPEGRRAGRRRLAEAVAAGRAGDATGVPVLLETLAQHGSVIWRASAARLLAQFTTDESVRAALVAAARDEAPLVRASAAFALAEAVDAGQRDAGVHSALLTAATDPVRTVRLNAAWGLRADPTVDPALFAEWEHSMALLAEHPETQHTLGVFHADRGDDARAEAAYRHALRLAPDSVPPRHNLALLLAARGDTDAAERELAHLRTHAPGFAAAACALGGLLADAGRWDEAARALQDCLRRDPTYPGALADLARAYDGLGRPQVTDRVLRAALDHASSRADALRALIAVRLARGDRAAAGRWARRAVRRVPLLAVDGAVRPLLEP